MLSMWLIVFIFALAHAVVLGLPAFFVASKLNLTQWWMSIVCGFIIGTVPFAISDWRNTLSALVLVPGMDETDNGVYVIKNGVITMAWWYQNIFHSSIFGVFGILGAYSAWLVWRYFPAPAYSEMI